MVWGMGGLEVRGGLGMEGLEVRGGLGMVVVVLKGWWWFGMNKNVNDK